MMTELDIARMIHQNGDCRNIDCYGNRHQVHCPFRIGSYQCNNYEGAENAAHAYLEYHDGGYLSMDTNNCETDPNGIKPSEPGAKLDAGKVKAGILADFRLALMEVARVGSVGAEKYSRGGWQSVDNGVARYTDAAWRHLLSPEEYDNGDGGTGCLHEAQVIWNLLAALELKLREHK